MGRLVESLAEANGFQVAGYLDRSNNAQGEALKSDRFLPVDAAIDFSTSEAVVVNLPLLAARGVNVVIGTTGWHAEEARLRQIASEAGIGVVASANFSPGVQVFQTLVEQAARIMAGRSEFRAWLYELHHAQKRDAPSGTARLLLRSMEQMGLTDVNVASTRAGFIPGTHTVGFDSPFETITLEHVARDRATFAGGALEAARWVRGKRGWFSIRDVMGLSVPAERNLATGDRQ